MIMIDDVWWRAYSTQLICLDCLWVAWTQEEDTYEEALTIASIQILGHEELYSWHEVDISVIFHA